MGLILETGVPLKVKGKPVPPEAYEDPEIIRSGKPRIVYSDLNVRKIPEDPFASAPHKITLKTSMPGSDLSGITLLSSDGYPVTTGIPIPCKGKTVPLIQPEPVLAYPPQKSHTASSNITFMDVDQGINSSYVYTMLEDSFGNLWFGTGREGVSRYNGVSFIHFTEDEGLSSNYIRSVIEDSKGNIWFGTYLGGLCKYDGETFTHFSEQEGLTNNNIWAVLEDRQGNIWIGTDGGGVSKFDGNTITHYTRKEGLSDNFVYSILEDSKGNLWFGTYGGGVNRFDGEGFTHFTREDGLGDEWVRTILEDSRGNLWFGTGSGGVNMYDGETIKHYTTREGLCDNHIYSILEDYQGNIWIGTDNGVSLFEGDRFTNFTDKEGLSSNHLRSILEDHQGNLWFGTEGGGVSIYRGKTFKQKTENEYIRDNWVISILEDSKGNLWFGTFSDGVFRYNGDHCTNFTLEEGLVSNNVRDILEDRHGNIWFGTGGGVSRYDGEYFTNFTEKNGLVDNRVRTILEDRHGNLWFGARDGGITIYDGKTFSRLTENEGLSQNDVWTLVEDSHGNIWIGTQGGGVSRYDGEIMTHFTEKEGLNDNWIMSILEDRHGNLWFGTEGGGVSRFDGETFTYFTEKEGLSDNNVRTVIEDNNGNIWLGTLKGLNYLMFYPVRTMGVRTASAISGSDHDTLETVPTGPKIFTYSNQDGLKGMEFYPNSAWLDSNNQIWWGSEQSLTMLDMNSFKISAEAPEIRLDRIEINEHFVDYRDAEQIEELGIDFNGVARFYNYPLKLELPYNRNHLTFYFSAVDYTAPHKLRYSYKMDGINDLWTLPNVEAKADYRHMPHGTFTFHVRAINESQHWSEELEYIFTILPPWWLTWWAGTGYGIASLSLIIGLFRWRTSNLLRRQKELKNEVESATLAIHAQKLEVESQRDQLAIQRDLVVKQKTNITDSINYALRIQTAVLPSREFMDAILPEYFIINIPRDIVSGDFYWAKEVQDHIVIALADCTGHGVPGALMSMLGITLLHDLIGDRCFDAPGAILERLRLKIKELLVQDGNGESQKDGMDMAIAILNKNNRELHFAGAHNSIYIVRKKEGSQGSQLASYLSLENDKYQLFNLKGDRQPIGIYWDESKFTTHSIYLQKHDNVYLFSDGIVDQKGGPNNRKFLATNFRKILMEIQDLSMEGQREILESTFHKWGKGLEQLDDVLVLGLKID